MQQGMKNKLFCDATIFGVVNQYNALANMIDLEFGIKYD